VWCRYGSIVERAMPLGGSHGGLGTTDRTCASTKYTLIMMIKLLDFHFTFFFFCRQVDPEWRQSLRVTRSKRPEDVVFSMLHHYLYSLSKLVLVTSVVGSASSVGLTSSSVILGSSSGYVGHPSWCIDWFFTFSWASVRDPFDNQSPLCSR
jgi:hypothetical protein